MGDIISYIAAKFNTKALLEDVSKFILKNYYFNWLLKRNKN